jgi:hypothetical protein
MYNKTINKFNKFIWLQVNAVFQQKVFIYKYELCTGLSQIFVIWVS